MKFLHLIVVGLLSLTVPLSFSTSSPPGLIISRDSNGLQDVVTWDSYSLIIDGTRLMLWSGEFHSWRLPVPSLWDDIFEKVKALGFNCVSFYVHWGLVEYRRGHFDFDSFRSYKPFFDAAKKAGIYLIARPGPYINAETTGGGFPGWGTRVPGAWRSGNETYLHAIKSYVQKIGEIVAEAQITNGGPVVLVQPENEYSVAQGIDWPQPGYMQTLQDWYREAGIVVPMVLNDVNVAHKNYVPGSGKGEVDIYGYDGYPQGFDCSNPYTWIDNSLPTTWYQQQLEASRSSPNSVIEFQGGAFDPWGGPGYENCAILLNHEFERVFYKNLMSFATTIWNIYMIYGGTNWGGIAFPGAYTSYDYGSAITEYRTVDREKYSELKLQANFLKVSPAYLTSKPQNLIPNTINGSFTDNSDLAVTQLKDEIGKKTAFYIVRHAAHNSHEKSSYKLTVPTSQGKLALPRLGGSLTLDGRDSKVHVTDYSFGVHQILYSTAEIFTWKKFGMQYVIVLYGSYGEIHESAFVLSSSGLHTQKVVSGRQLVKTSIDNGVATISYRTSGRTIVQLNSDTLLYIVDRNTAYTFWTTDLPSDSGSAYNRKESVIVRGTYLLRSASIHGTTLRLRGDLNATSDIEVFTDEKIKIIMFNDRTLHVHKTRYGSWAGEVKFEKPPFSLPDLKELHWKSLDSLPELSPQYSDKHWTPATKRTTINPRPLSTPENLYSSDYGYHLGPLLYRAHFTATGSESGIYLELSGGSAFSFSTWLDSTFLGSFTGSNTISMGNKTFTFPKKLNLDGKHVITVVMDHQGLNEDWTAGMDEFKIPRGILNYHLISSASTKFSWKIAGNFGGEDYPDKTRTAYNENGLFFSRQGYHLPGTPTAGWRTCSPLEGIESAGVAFYKTSFELNLPENYDIPLAFEFSNCSATDDTLGTNFRALLYVNGWQFGKYVNNMGPQTSFPVPEGILNHRGSNDVGLALWALDEGGARVCGLALREKAVIWKGFGRIISTGGSAWQRRVGG